MNRTRFSLSLIVFLGFVAVSCQQLNRLTATRIKDILDQPRDYEKKEVTIHGTVAEAVSLLVVKYFVLQDKTGSIRVVTDRVLPKKGEELSVTGYVESIELGPERFIVLREKSETPG